MDRKKIRKKLLILLMILSIVSADFFVLGSQLSTYASEISNETNNPNVEFSAYFKNDAGEKVSSINKSIKSADLKLYTTVTVKNEGYINEGTTIEIEDSNFNIKNNILSPYIRSIEGNKITLKQITAGETVEIPIQIEPIILDKMPADMLTQKSMVIINGSYTGSTDGGIQYGKEVCISFTPDETASAELDAKLITNEVLSENGTNKRVVQVLIKSRLTENQYPIEQTKLTATIPNLGEEAPTVDVMAVGTLATNGGSTIGNVNKQNGKVEIEINNNAITESNNEISWNKNVYDELIITYLYPETVDTTDFSIEVDSVIKAYGFTKTYTGELPEPIKPSATNAVIMGKTEIKTGEINKGLIYTNTDAQYNTKTTIVVTNENVADTIVVKEVADVFGTGESVLAANTKYISTEINLNQMLDILGQTGSITIKNGEATTTINKDTEVNSDGNVVINHTNSTSELEITTSKPEKEGIIEINHAKVITGNSYTRAQLQTVKTLNAKNTTMATLNGTKIVENTTETATLELKETVTKAEMTIENNKNTLSTTEVNDVVLGIALVTNGTQYDLFKNPEITIQLPAAVESWEFNAKPSKQNADEFQISEPEEDINAKTIKIKLTGEQTTYETSAITQAYLQLNLKLNLSQLVATHTDRITMTYTNENATQYANGATNAGVVEKEIRIESQPGVLKMFNVSSSDNTSLTDTIKQQIKQENAGKILTFGTMLINNTDSDINNVRILGKLPTTGNTITGEVENTFETTLKNIDAQNATIYYTENATATDEVENTVNGWTTDLGTLTNAKMYLIKVDTLNKGSNYSAAIKVQMPATIEQGLISHSEYKVIYDTLTSSNIEETSRKIALVTSELKINLTAQVGQEELSDGAIVKEGEVIKYTATITNNTEQTIENIALIAGVPEGTVVVVPMENYEYVLGGYYEEKTDAKEMTVTIPTLSVGATYTLQYEVRVKSDITTGTEISNQIQATYNSKTAQSSKITNKLEESNIRVTIKKAIDRAIKLTAGSEVQYNVIIENLSNEKVNGLEINIGTEDFILESQEGVLGEIPANGMVNLKLKGKIINDSEISVVVTDSNNRYRSNVIVENLIKADATINLTSPQNNASLKEGDIVEYNIVVKNTGSISEYFKVYYSISEDLAVQTVKINGNIISQASDEKQISNLIYEGMNLDVGAEGIINITAKVKSVTQTKVINNNARVEVLNVYKDISDDITHTLQAQETTQPDDPTNPDDPSKPDQPTNPDDPTNPDQPTNPDDPSNPNNPGGTTNPDQPADKKSISGLAWLDLDRNGKKDATDTVLAGIKVKIYNVSTNNYLVDGNGNVVQVETDANGKYAFTNIEKGSYILVFEYDIEKYEPTINFAEGVGTTVNSKVVLKKININGQEITAAVTDTINVQENVSNLNIGLKEKLIFDLELDKYISRIVVQTNQKTKTYDYQNDTFEKVEIHRKQIQGALVVLEYTVKVKNNGEIAGYAKNIVDYLPSGLTFSSELNTDWYLSGTYLYTKGLENVQINPGEEKEIKLILTKTMTNENIGLINNRAEIYQDYNKYGDADIDSTPNNQNQNEDDYGSVDVIIGVSTGGSITMYIALLITNLVLIGVAIKLMIQNNIIKIPSKKERR